MRSSHLRPCICVACALVLAGCGASRSRLDASRPWQVAASAVNHPPRPIPVTPPRVEERAPQISGQVDPRLREKVTLRSEATDLRALLLGLSKQTGINIVLDEEVSGTVSAYLNEVEVLEALKRIVAPLGFEVEVKDNFVRVFEPVVETRMYRLQYLRGDRTGESKVSMVDRSSAGLAAMGGQGGMGGGMGGMGGMGGGMGGGAGGMGGQAQGAAGGGPGGGSQTEITSKFTVHFWRDLSAELESLVFDGAVAEDLVRNDRGESGISIYEKASSPPDPKSDKEDRAAPAAPSAKELQAQAYRARRHVGRSLTVNSMSGTIVVRARPAVLDSIGRYLAAVEETVQRQVIVDIRILEVSLSDGLRFGVEGKNLPFLPSELLTSTGLSNAGFTSPQGFPTPDKTLAQVGVDQEIAGLEGPPGIGQLSPNPQAYGLHLGVAGKWNAVVQMLSTLGDVRVVSAPRISALHNQKAIVKVVRDRVFYLLQAGSTALSQGTSVSQQSQFVPVVVPEGIVVDVTPLIGDDGTVTLEVHPSFSVIFNEKQAPGGQGSQPEVERRELQTTVRVNGEQTVVLGGLVAERTQRKERGVPLLKDIPYLGAIFRRTEETTEKAELIVLMTPRVQGAVALRDYVNGLGVLEEQEKLPPPPAGTPAEAAPSPPAAPAPAGAGG